MGRGLIPFKTYIRTRRIPSLAVISVVLLLLSVGRGAPGENSVTYGPSPWTNWSIGNVVIRALAIDGDFLWIGTSNGLIQFNKKTEEHRIYTARDGLLSNVVVSITIDRHGNKWLGTYGGGLNRFDGKRWEVFTPFGTGTKEYGPQWVQYPRSNGLGDLWVYNVFFDLKETMWVATWKGASHYSGRGFVTYTMNDGLVDKWVYTIAQDSAGVLWFGTEGGINSFDGRKFRGWTHKDGLGAGSEGKSTSRTEDNSYASPHHQQSAKENAQANPNYVIASVIDKKGVKWFGTWGGGLSRFDGIRFRNFTTKDGLAGNVVNALALDLQGNLWIGTNQGVSRFDGQAFTTLTTQDGLFENNVYSIAIDHDGSKWFGTFGGISHYTGV